MNADVVDRTATHVTTNGSKVVHEIVDVSYERGHGYTYLTRCEQLLVSTVAAALTTAKVSCRLCTPVLTSSAPAQTRN